MKRIKSLKKALAFTLSGAMLTAGVNITTAAKTNFSDVGGHWSEYYINQWVDWGVINGYEDGSFRPDNYITRAEMVKMIVSITGAKDYKETDFSDIGDGAWYDDYVLGAVSSGYATGYDDNSFRPDSFLTREEACAIVARAFDYTNTGTLDFKDNNAISDWSKSYVRTMVGKGIIVGYEDNTFRAKSNITRAELAKVLYMAKYPNAIPTKKPSTAATPVPRRSRAKPNHSETSSTVMITFDAGEGTFEDGYYNDYITYARGARVEPNMPSAPEREGYAFDGWSTNKVDILDMAHEWASSSKTYYAVWHREEMYDLVYHLGDNNASVMYESYWESEKTQKPGMDGFKRDNWTFTGKWYTDPQCTKEYTFDTYLTSDLDIYAGWQPNAGVATLDLYMENTVSDKNIEVEAYPVRVAAGDKVLLMFNIPENLRISEIALKYTAADDTEQVLESETDEDGCMAVFAYPEGAKKIKVESVSTAAETPKPTAEPTRTPTAEPSETPKPTLAPTATPTADPSVTAEPTLEPTGKPTANPISGAGTGGMGSVGTEAPMATPTMEPTLAPTATPTMEPTLAPTATPTLEPTLAPTATPTLEPTLAPTSTPTMEPTLAPTATPTMEPTLAPTATPTLEPTLAPTSTPTLEPTLAPTATPDIGTSGNTDLGTDIKADNSTGRCVC